MFDINKILITFEKDLKSKSQEERISYLKNMGFDVSAQDKATSFPLAKRLAPKSASRKYKTSVAKPTKIG